MLSANILKILIFVPENELIYSNCLIFLKEFL